MSYDCTTAIGVTRQGSGRMKRRRDYIWPPDHVSNYSSYNDKKKPNYHSENALV